MSSVRGDAPETVYVRFGACQFQVHHWDRAGAGAPLLALHGFTGDGLDFEALAEHLPGRSIVAPDLLGHGDSSAPPEPQLYALEEQREQVCAIAKAVGIERPVLLGYSMGGRLALEIACGGGLELAALALVGATPGLEDAEERAQRRRRDDELAEEVLEGGAEAFLARWQRVPIIATQARAPSPWRERMLARRQARSAEGLAASLRGGGAGSMRPRWDALERIRCPALLITGEEDSKFERIARRMLTRLPAAEHVTIEGAGHAAHMERPAAAARELAASLERRGL